MAKFKFPSVLTYNKTIQPSTGVFYSLFDVNVEGNKVSYESKDGVVITTVGIRAAKSNYEDNVDAKADKLAESNLQRIDTASLAPESEWLLVDYNVSFNNNIMSPHSCNDLETYERMVAFANKFESVIGYKELIVRYLKNIINANTMWKNKSFAEEGYVTIEYYDSKNSVQREVHFNINFKDDFSVQEESQQDFDLLCEVLISKMTNKEVFTMNVKNFLKMGKGQSVYPSEEFVDDKNSVEGRSKVLSSYKNSKGRNIATYHNVKIGNAIRRIDDWHDHPSEKRVPVEMFAPDLNFARILRNSTNNFYSLLEKKLENYEKSLDKNDVSEEETNELNYIVACLIRGGVFNGKSKK